MTLRAGAVLLLVVWLGPALARADDWSLTRPPAAPRESGARPGPRGKALTIERDPEVQTRLRARYVRVLLSEPGQPLALERLLALYRERDGNLDGLARELAERSEKEAESWALWLLRARVDAARAEHDAARAACQRAAQLAPLVAEPLLLQAQLEREAGELIRAAELLERALSKTKDAQQRIEILRNLGELALDRQDFESARRQYAALAATQKGGVVGATAHARALAAHGQRERAVAAYEEAIALLHGDARVLPPVLLEMARLQLEASDSEGALATLARARALAPPGEGVRYELDEVLVEVHRRLGRLGQLAAQLAKERARSFAQSELLGRVYDELGDQPKALAALRQALVYDPRRVDARERVIRILSQRGELGQAIAEYRALLRAAPREPRFVIELSKLLMESGKRDEALRLLDQTASRFPHEGRIQRSLFELYSRWDEHARAARVLSQLSRIEPEDPTHWVALGEQRLERGDQAGALALFRRILDTVSDKAQAHATLAGTYLDHDMPDRALVEYEAAVRAAPRGLEYVRGLAETLEKMQRPADAAERWQQVLDLATDPAQRREARRRVVRLWSQSGGLQRKIAELEHAFGWPSRGARNDGGKQPDVEAGRFLAECYRALASGRRRAEHDPRYLDAAERVLSRVLEIERGDIESLLALERLRALRGNLAGAIDVLSRLLEANPKNAATYLSRMAEHALAIYRDDDAIGYAERLVALNPSDAKAQERLGDLYRARQNDERAVQSYERAIALDQNAFAVHLELAELYLSRAQGEKAYELLRRVVRACPDDELVKRAARSSIQLGLGTARLSSLEQELLPLALGNSRRPVYRAMLIELYDAMTRPLLEAAREGGAAGDKARGELRLVAERAIAPLLEALSDADPMQRRVAIDLLGQLRSEHATAALLAAAERDGDTLLRRRAVLAAGVAAPPALAGRFAALAAAPERRLRDAAAWALARMSGPSAVAQLRGLLASNTPSVRGYALLGLGRLRDSASTAAFRRSLGSDRSAFVRGAAALALALSGDRASISALAIALRTEQGDAAVAVAIALGLLADRAALEPLVEALFSSETGLRRAALWALRNLGRDARTARPVGTELAEPDERSSLEPILRAWLSLEPELAVADAVRAFRVELQQAAEGAMRGSPDASRVALALLSGADPSFTTDADRAALAPLVAALQPAISGLAQHPDPSIRSVAFELLRASAAGEASAALLAALEDGDEQVQSTALDRIGSPDSGSPRALERVAEIATQDRRWWVRLRAVAALGRVGSERAASWLLPVLASDPYAYVREGAAAALGATRSAQAVSALSAALTRDAEPRVRLAAARALEKMDSPEARQALQRMDPRTKAALQANERRN